MRIKYIYIIALMLAGGEAYGQLYPERSLIRQGNRAYEGGSYVESEVLYRRALEKSPESYEAYSNLANSLYKQEQYGEAENIYSRLLADTANIRYLPDAFYNQGNAYFQQRKLEEAIESYKNTLRINPSDVEAKFNLAYAKKLLEDGQEDGRGDDEGENEQEQEQQQDGGDQNNDDRPQDNRQQQQQSAMDPLQAEQMLQAVQQAEDRTRERMNEQQVQTGVRSGRNW